MNLEEIDDNSYIMEDLIDTRNNTGMKMGFSDEAWRTFGLLS